MLAIYLCYLSISASLLHASHPCLPPPASRHSWVSIYFIPLSTFFSLRANHEPEFGAYYFCLFFCLSGSIIPNSCSRNSSTCPFFIVAIYYPSWRSTDHFLPFRLNFDIILISITVSVIWGLKLDINFSSYLIDFL